MESRVQCFLVVLRRFYTCSHCSQLAESDVYDIPAHRNEVEVRRNAVVARRARLVQEQARLQWSLVDILRYFHSSGSNQLSHHLQADLTAHTNEV